MANAWSLRDMPKTVFEPGLFPEACRGLQRPDIVVTQASPHRYFLFKDFYLFLERGKGRRKKGRETLICGCLSHVPHWEPGPQPRHVP